MGFKVGFRCGHGGVNQMRPERTEFLILENWSLSHFVKVWASTNYP